MLLVNAQIGPFRSINKPQTVVIDEKITVLVGMNEAAKTVFLQALQKANDALGLAAYNPVDDYPRKDLSAYLKAHKTKPAEVAILTFRLSNSEVEEINKVFYTKLPPNFEFSLNYSYNNKSVIGISINEQPVIDALANTPDLSSDAKTAVKKAKTIRDIQEQLKSVSLTEGDKTFFKDLEARITKAPAAWDTVVEYEVWTWLSRRVPKFLYFSDYDLLPSKMNLNDLAQRAE